MLHTEVSFLEMGGCEVERRAGVLIARKGGSGGGLPRGIPSGADVWARVVAVARRRAGRGRRPSVPSGFGACWLARLLLLPYCFVLCSMQGQGERGSTCAYA